MAAFSVVLGTLILQGLTLRPVLSALGIKHDDIVDRETDLARTVAARAALKALDEQPFSMAVKFVRREYEARLRQGDETGTSADSSNRADLANVQRTAIAAERRAVAELRSRGDIGDDAFHRLEEELDWVEVHVARRVSSQEF